MTEILDTTDDDDPDVEICAEDIGSLVRAWHDRGVDPTIMAGLLISGGVQVAYHLEEPLETLTAGVQALYERLDRDRVAA